MKVIYTLLLVFLQTFAFAQPINDSPCMDDANPPFNLGFNGSHTGTTCDAIGYNDDPTKDKKNVKCNSASDDNAVWYVAKLDSLKEGININIAKGTIGNISSVEVFAGDTNAICKGTARFLKSKCNGLPVINMHIGCIDVNEFVFIKVASFDNNCGTFTISVNGINDCDIADNCEDITEAQELNPISPNDPEVNFVCLNGCLDLACTNPDLPYACKGFDTQPTVWFRVNTDQDAGQLYTTVTTDGNWTPVWSVFYSPNNDCSNLMNAAGSGGSYPCSIDASPPAPPLITGVTEGTYYIAVSADTGDVINDPNFEVCAATIKNVTTCIGPVLGCGNDDSLIFKITQRENIYAEPDGPPYSGPFCPGEEVTVQVNFLYDARYTADEWLLGFIPKFGNGWNLNDFDFANNLPVAVFPAVLPMDSSKWYSCKDSCAPLVTENYWFLCTYIDDDGELRLCNTMCENCPCSSGMEKGDTLPSGYFWVQEGQSLDCDVNDCSPSKKYGIGSSFSIINWEFHLKVKEFENQNDCRDNNDLGISFMTFSDGGAGCWDDPIAECLLDKPQFSPSWRVDCDISSGIIATPLSSNICTGEVAEIKVVAKNGTTDSIQITFENNPNVVGVNNHLFANGVGMINDVLTIKDNSLHYVEVVNYFAHVIEDKKCDTKIDTIKVNVYPKPKIILQDTIQTVFKRDLPYLFKIELVNSNSENSSFSWNDDYGNSGIGDSIIITDSFGTGLHTFTITIINEHGCKNTEKYKINILDSGFTPFIINKQIVNVSCYNECDGAIAILNVANSSYPISYKWSNGDTTALISNLCSGKYYVTIIDANDNKGVDTLTITQPNEILITVDTVLNISPSSVGRIFITTNNNGNYKFIWSGPKDFSAMTQNITNLDEPGCYTLVVTDTISDCSQDTTICIEKTNSREVLLLQKSPYIVPNPNTGKFNLILEDMASNKVDIEIFTNKGKKVIKKTYKTGYLLKNIKFNFDEFPSGIYFLKIITKNKIEVLKFVSR